MNLAYVCAQGGYTTLMIDGDLRRPQLHTFFDVNNADWAIFEEVDDNKKE